MKVSFSCCFLEESFSLNTLLIFLCFSNINPNNCILFTFLFSLSSFVPAGNLNKLCCSSGCHQANRHHHHQALAKSLWKQKRRKDRYLLEECRGVARNCHWPDVLNSVLEMKYVPLYSSCVLVHCFLRKEQQCFLG